MNTTLGSHGGIVLKQSLLLNSMPRSLGVARETALLKTGKEQAFMKHFWTLSRIQKIRIIRKCCSGQKKIWEGESLIQTTFIETKLTGGLYNPRGFSYAS
jgi:hypothetical protein